ncbi:MAG: hypothetical protein V4670_09200 [Bacteroidota bacterium]
MKFKIILLYLFVFNLNLYCQQEKDSSYRIDNVGQFSKYNYGAWLPGVYEDKSLKGSAYLNDNWEGKHQIRLSSGEPLSIASLNYNLVKNTLESKISKDSVFQIDSKNIDYVKLNTKKYKFFNLEGKTVLANVLYLSPKVTLIKVVNISISKATINPLTQQVTSEAAFVKNEKYLIRKGDRPFENFELKRKGFMNFFAENSNKLNDFSKNKNLSFESENNIFSIFEFYDSI